MSYEIAKSISLKEKENKVFITCASNNVYPHTYSKWEFLENAQKSFEWKIGLLVGDICGGNIQPVNSLYKIHYAVSKTREVFNNIDLYDALCSAPPCYYVGKKPYRFKSEVIEITEEEANNGEYTLLYENDTRKEYYKENEKVEEEKRVEELAKEIGKTFLRFFNEKHSGKYYLVSDHYGVIKPRGTKGAFFYSHYGIDINDCLMDYFKAYMLSKVCAREYSNVEVKAFA